MPIINSETFEKRRKKLRLTAKEIAFRAQVTETTVGKIKKNKNLQNYPVEKIAEVLSMSVEQITNPPDEDLSITKNTKLYNDDDLIAASILYNVSASWILEHSALFFHILAQKMFTERLIKVKKLEKDFESLDNEMPYKDELIDGWKEFYLEGINEERRAISRNNLSGPRDTEQNQNAKFINFLSEIGEELLDDFEMYDAFAWDSNAKKHIEKGAELSNMIYYTGLREQASFHLLGKLLGPEEGRAREAVRIITTQQLLHEIPIRLRTPDRAEELVDWVIQWRDNAYETLLQDTLDEEINHKRSLMKAALKQDAEWEFSNIYHNLKQGPIDDVVDSFIKKHLPNSFDGEDTDA